MIKFSRPRVCPSRERELANQHRVSSGFTRWPGGKPYAVSSASLNRMLRRQRSEEMPAPPPPRPTPMASTSMPVLDPCKGLPVIAQRVYGALVGAACAGDPLPSTQNLMAIVGASKHAVLEAMLRLEDRERIVSDRRASDGMRVFVEIPGVGTLRA